MGVMRILDYFDMYDLKNINMTEIKELVNEENLNGPPHTVLCSRGFWVIFNEKRLDLYYYYPYYLLTHLTALYKNRRSIGSLSWG
jgi:hypothetical protein